MNILFLTMIDIRSAEERNIYMDLMRTFAMHGHCVFIVSPIEKRYKQNTCCIKAQGIEILKVRTGNLFGVGMVEKGISQVRLGRQYQNAIRNRWHAQSFDLIVYSTPPITLAGAVKQIKADTGAKTYLLLKDIFPQNAVDIGLMSKWMSALLFRKKEKLLYRVSDYIGCMSPANVEYLLAHNDIDRERVEICPNSIIPENVEALKYAERRTRQREKFCRAYHIPCDRALFLYGGNLGKPQDIPFLIQCVKAAGPEEWAHFVICGKGTELPLLQAYIKEETPANLTVIPGLPKLEYEEMTAFCDVGMIFLDHRFTIPNFPSRALSYMEKKLPMLICTDPNSDMGRIAEENHFGKYCPSDSAEAFLNALRIFKDEEVRRKMGECGRRYLEENYTAERGYQIIMQHFIR